MQSSSKTLFSTLILILFFITNLSFAATRYSVASGNWNLTTTWSASSGGASGASVPVAGDVVVLENGYSVTVTADAACASINFSGAAATKNATLSIDPGITLTLTSTITLTSLSNANNAGTITGTGNIVGCTALNVGTSVACTADGIATLTFSSCTLTTAAVTLQTSRNNSGGWKVYNAGLNINSGTLNCSGTFQTTYVGTGNTCTVNMSGGAASGILKLGGTITSASGSTYTLGGGTQVVNYYSAAAQNILPSSNGYYHLKSNNTSGASLTAATTVSILSIGDETGNSIFNDGGFQLTSTGTLNLVSGTFRLTKATTPWPAFTTNNITAGTIVEYGSASAQTISSTPSYSNLSLTGGNYKTLDGDIVIPQNLTVTSTSTIYVKTGTYKLTVNGTTTTNQTGAGITTWHYDNTGVNYELNGPLIFGASSGTMWFGCDGAGTGQLNLGGNITQNPGGQGCSALGMTVVTFNKNGLQTFDINNSTASQAFEPGTTTTNIGDGVTNTYLLLTGTGTANPEIRGNLNVKAGSTLDLGTHTMNCIGAGKTLTLEAGATLRLAASSGGQTGSNFPSGFTTYNLDPASTVEYYGGNGVNQTIYDVATGYGNLILTNDDGSGSTTKSATGALDIKGDLTISDAYTTFNTGTSLTHTILGDWINNGTTTNLTYTTANTINFNGTSAQSIEGTSGTTFYNLTIDNSSGAGNGVTQNTAATIDNILTLSNGPFNLNSLTAILTNGATTAISRTSGYIVSETQVANNTSKLQWNIDATTGAHVFPFGTTAGNYIPVTFNNSGNAGNVSIATRNTATSDNTPYAAASNVAAVSSMAGVGTPENAVIDRWWDITSSLASPISSVDLTLSYYGTENTLTVGANDNMGVQHWTGSAWNDGKGGGTSSITASGNNGVTGASVGTIAVTGITEFSPFIGVRSAAPLPIELVYFYATFNDKVVDITWTTFSETNNDYFIVERSTDGINFYEILKTDGAGNSNSELNYLEVDENPLEGKSYYRLKQVDFDGHYTYSRVVSVYLSKIDFISSIYPNPVNDILNIRLNTTKEQQSRLIITDIKGQSVYDESISHSNLIKVNTDLFSSGVYFLTIITEVGSWNEKLIKK